MLNKDYRDLLAGLLMMAMGLFVYWYAKTNYDLGTLNRMGPGFFPVGLGILLAIVGFFICLPALFRRGQPLTISTRTLVLVTASIIVFAATLKTLGIVVATMLAVVISSLADNEMTWRGRASVAVGIAVVVWLIFIYGLSMILPVWPWSP